jgi:hypothetical protein
MGAVGAGQEGSFLVASRNIALHFVALWRVGAALWAAYEMDKQSPTY